MKINYPYEKRSVRSKRLWDEAAKVVCCHPVLLREAYFRRWFTGIDAKDFISLIKSGEIKVGKSDLPIWTDEEINNKQIASDKEAEESDFCDLLNWRLKQIIEIGDSVVSDETKTFCFSNKQYQTKGKKYKITDLKDEGGSSFGYCSTSDIRGERIWGSVYSVKSLWRGRKEIYNWDLAYLELFKEQNPDHPQTEKMIQHCNERAQKTRVGNR